ncbi:EAL domain-containing protein [Micromonospora sp. NPDC048830]|uniref:EAL domain-containing protein n=1 Tax=Micromonospora sp. NPDC048830 TaxID=3364257 RepID=UPI003719CB00
MAIETTATALRTRANWFDVARSAWIFRLTIAGLQVTMASMLVGIISAHPGALPAIPAAFLVTWAIYRQIVKLVADRRAWEHILAISDALSDHDLTTVLQTATHGAGHVFSASATEIELQVAGQESRLVRAYDTSPYDGPPNGAEPLPIRPSKMLTMAGPGFHFHFRLYAANPNIRSSKHGARILNAFAATLTTAIANALKYQSLKHYAFCDALTGLPNRRGLIEDLQRRAGEEFAVAIVEIGNLKEISSALGRSASDELLRIISDRLLPQAEESHIAARVGGDCFALVVSQPHARDAVAYIEGILRRTRLAVDISGILTTVRAHAGMTFSTVEDTVEAVLDRATDALTRSRREMFQPIGISLLNGVSAQGDVRRRKLLTELPDAIQAGQIRAMYMPVVDLISGAPVAIEVTPEWLHPQHGELPSSEWSELARRGGLTGQLTAEMLRQTLLAAEVWRAAGFDLPAALTVSGEELSLDHRLPARIFGQLLGAGTSPDRLILEVAETDPIVDSYILDELRAGGVMLALKNFGSGRCSLATLGRISFQGVMIDRSFVADLHSRPAAVVAKAAVVLGGDLGVNVAAEGIESHEQRVLLASMGCRFGQGPLVGGPTKLTTLLATLREGKDSPPGLALPPLSSSDLVVPLMSRRAS